jgi:protein-S-isoprenylcysteine O-methyltransferase Ste14
MFDYHKRHSNSVLAEWVLKITLLFFVASIFFDDSALEFAKEDVASSWGIMVYIKIALIIAYGIVISAISKAAFKIVGFTTIIIGSVFKIVLTISIENFVLVDTINLADSILLIGVAYFYLYRHHRHEKKSKKVVKKKKRHS